MTRSKSSSRPYRYPFVSVLPWNAHGLYIQNKARREVKLRALFKRIRRADIVCLQETHLSRHDGAVFKKRMLGQGYKSIVMYSKGASDPAARLQQEEDDSAGEASDLDAPDSALPSPNGAVPAKRPRTSHGSALLYKAILFDHFHVEAFVIIPFVAHGAYFSTVSTVDLSVINVHLDSSSAKTRRSQAVQLGTWPTYFKRRHFHLHTANCLMMVAGDTNVTMGLHEKGKPSGDYDPVDYRQDSSARSLQVHLMGPHNLREFTQPWPTLLHKSGKSASAPHQLLLDFPEAECLILDTHAEMVGPLPCLPDKQGTLRPVSDHMPVLYAIRSPRQGMAQLPDWVLTQPHFLNSMERGLENMDFMQLGCWFQAKCSTPSQGLLTALRFSAMRRLLRSRIQGGASLSRLELTFGYATDRGLVNDTLSGESRFCVPCGCILLYALFCASHFVLLERSLHGIERSLGIRRVCKLTLPAFIRALSRGSFMRVSSPQPTMRRS